MERKQFFLRIIIHRNSSLQCHLYIRAPGRWPRNCSICCNDVLFRRNPRNRTSLYTLRRQLQIGYHLVRFKPQGTHIIVDCLLCLILYRLRRLRYKNPCLRHASENQSAAEQNRHPLIEKSVLLLPHCIIPPFVLIQDYSLDTIIN